MWCQHGSHPSSDSGAQNMYSNTSTYLSMNNSLIRRKIFRKINIFSIWLSCTTQNFSICLIIFLHRRELSMDDYVTQTNHARLNRSSRTLAVYRTITSQTETITPYLFGAVKVLVWLSCIVQRPAIYEQCLNKCILIHIMI